MQTAFEFSTDTYQAAMLFVCRLEIEVTTTGSAAWIAAELAPKVPPVPARVHKPKQRGLFERFQKFIQDCERKAAAA